LVGHQDFRMKNRNFPIDYSGVISDIRKSEDNKINSPNVINDINRDSKEGVMKYPLRLAFLIVVILNITVGGNDHSKIKNGTPQLTNVNYWITKKIEQGFNLRVWMNNVMTFGSSVWGSVDDIPDGIGMKYPSGTAIEHLYSGGALLGAIINGVPRVDDFTWWAPFSTIPDRGYRAKARFWRTTMWSNDLDTMGYSGYYFNNGIVVNRKGVDDDGDGKIDEDELDGLDNDGDWNPLTDDVGADGLPDSIEVSCDGQPYDSETNPDPAGDNFDSSELDKCHPLADGTFPLKDDREFYTEKNGIPDHGEPHVDEDYGAVSDNDIYCSVPDTFPASTVYQKKVLGAQVFQKTYAWCHSSADAFISLDYVFVNRSSSTWNDAYIGYFADADVGPISVSNYYQHNYSAYDSSTRTAYVHNPIDKGSTPIGVTILGVDRSFDSLTFVYQWSDFTTRPSPGTDDSIIFTWMNGSAFPGQPIAPNQSPDSCSDTRFLISFGPYTQVNPGDTIKTTFAYVSGTNVDDMLNNAKRAHRIYRADGFVMPVVSLCRSEIGDTLNLSWNIVGRSPFGVVTSYRVYHGTTSQIYTDSLSVPDLAYTFTSLSGDSIHYFAVAAVDENGNIGALSDEVSSAPTTDVSMITGAIPNEYRLYGAYPNPFNPVTVIKFDIPQVSNVSLVIYDVLGREVSRLLDERKAPGRYEATFDANRLASGVYYYQIVAGSFSTVKKMLLMK
jgi:hypothetical protein